MSSERREDMSFKDILSEEDRKVFEKGGYGRQMGYGERPALLVVDMTYAFMDSAYDQASGDIGCKAIEVIKPLLTLCRKKKVPVIYTVPRPHTPLVAGYKFGISQKKPLLPDRPGSKENEIVGKIGPANSKELLIAKTKASAFLIPGLFPCSSTTT